MAKWKRYCSNCGAEIDPRAKICPKCGVEQAPLVEHVSDAWYLVPFFFGIIGGLIAWFVNKDRNPGKARNFLIFGIVWTAILFIIAWVVLMAIFISATTPLISTKTKQVLIKVEYNGEWKGAYGDITGIVSWSGTGSKTVTLDRPSDSYVWIISANAQKMDGSSNTLTIEIMKTDGTLLKKASTTAPYGIVQVSYTVQD